MHDDFMITTSIVHVCLGKSSLSVLFATIYATQAFEIVTLVPDDNKILAFVHDT